MSKGHTEGLSTWQKQADKQTSSQAEQLSRQMQAYRQDVNHVKQTHRHKSAIRQKQLLYRSRQPPFIRQNHLSCKRRHTPKPLIRQPARETCR